MTATVRALYVDSDGGIAEELSTGDIEVLRASSGIDALKRLQSETVDCVVVNTDVADLPLERFVHRVRDGRPDLPVLLHGKESDPSPTVEVLTEEATDIITDPAVESVRKGIKALVTGRRLDTAIEENRRLEDAIRAFATRTATLTDRVDIEEALYESIMEADLYEFAWIGQVANGSVHLQYPMEGDFDPAELASLVGVSDASFIERAVVDGSVQTVNGEANTRSTSSLHTGMNSGASPTVATDGSTVQPGMSSVAVPIGETEGTPNVLLLATTRRVAFDGAETEHLADLGNIAKSALQSSHDGQPTSEETDRARRFAESLAHELRTPLGVASAHLEIGRETGDEESFKRVEGALERLDGVIDGILAVARNDAVESPTMGSLEADVEEAWSALDDPSVELILEGSVEYSADHPQVVRALSNLFRNALDHTTDPVTIRIGPLSDGFYVADNGPGIPPDRHEEVFEWGFTTVADGTGIGLSIVKEIVDLHGWDITITESAEGGARFEITGIDIAPA